MPSTWIYGDPSDFMNSLFLQISKKTWASFKVSNDTNSRSNDLQIDFALNQLDFAYLDARYVFWNSDPLSVKPPRFFWKKFELHGRKK